MRTAPRPARTIRQKLFLGVAGAAALAVTACGTAAASSASSANQMSSDALGAWHVTSAVAGSTSTFDTLYGFGTGGVFTRVDGRNNAPGLGTWTAQGPDGVTIGFVVFQFNSTGTRIGTVTATAQATVQADHITGTFVADGVDLTGAPLPGFPKHGTFDGVRIKT